MNVFDVLRGKLEEKKQNHLHDEKVMQEIGLNNLSSFCSAKARSLDGAIEIVNQVEKEYSDGWIPCSERLPEEDGAYLVTLYSKYYQQFEVDLLSYNKKYGEWNDIVDRDYSDEVIAWKQLPEPFEKV